MRTANGRERVLPAVAERRAREEAFKSVGPLPSRLSPRQIETLAADGSVGARALNGQALRGTMVAGAAAVLGRARVVTAQKEIESFEDGEILVTRYIAPDWIPIFSRAAGIVTEVGGWLSHTSILAREFNVTTIVGVNGATGCISNGDVVKLNLDGTVECV